MRYYITPNYSVASNAKVGSTALSRAIIAAFYPDLESIIQNAAYPAGVTPGTQAAHWLCPAETTPSKTVVLVVRDPVDRFASAMTQLGLTDVEAALASLEQGSAVEPPGRKVRYLADDIHFIEQGALACGPTRLFRYEELDQAANYIGLPPLPRMNEARSAKPKISADQKQRIRLYYAKDLALYESIPVGGRDLDGPPPSGQHSSRRYPGRPGAPRGRIKPGVAAKPLNARK